MLGEVPTIQPELSGDFATLMGWADAIRRMKVRANAETALDARTARRFGAEGIGLSRTEHMFFEADRIGPIRRVIMADDEEGRRAGLAELLPMQRADFAEIFRIMKGLPVTIRLLDPPFHEFLPKTDAEFDEMARLTGRDVAQIRQRALALHEIEPDAGPSRLPPRHHLSRNLRDAGDRDLRSGGDGHQRAGRRRSSPRSWCR